MAFGAGSVDVVVRFLTDASSVEKEAGKFDGIGGKLKKTALGIGTAIGGAFAIDKVSDFVGAAEEAQVASDRLAKVMANAGDATGDWWRHAEDLATSLMNQTGIDDEVIKGGQAILGTFHTLAGQVGQSSGAFDRATKASLDMSKTGFGSVESASTMLGKALEDPAKGLTALGRVGITFSEDQKKAISAMVESGDKAGAMNAILNNVEGQVGGVAEATATASDKMKTSWGETQEAIGGLFLPVLQKVQPYVQDAAKWVQDKLIPAIERFIGWLSDHRDEIASYFQPFVDGVKKVIPPILALGQAIAGYLQPVFEWLGSWISEHKDIFPAIAIAIMTLLVPAFIAWAINAGIAAAATLAAAAPFIIIGAAITALAYLIIANWDTIKSATEAVWNAILGAVQAVWDWISSNWPLLLAILTGPFGLAVKLIVDNWDSILSFFKSLPGKIGDALSTLGGIILAPFQWAWDKVSEIKDKLVGIGDAVVGGFTTAWNAFARGFNNLAIPSFSIGGWSTPFGDLPSWDSPRINFPDLPILGSGGIVMRPTVALIGERGPEAVVPLNRMGGGANVTINVIADGLGADSHAIQTAVVDALRQYTVRNGPLPALIVGA